MAENSSASLYFAYGSNLSPFQMKARCPEAEPLGLAHLPHPWAWLINERGYANVVDTSRLTTTGQVENGTTNGAATPAEAGPGVYGVLYHLPPDDEVLLDGYEGVPFAYQKSSLPVTIVASKSSGKPKDMGSTTTPDLQPSGIVEALVYVDHNNTNPSQPQQEYIARMNRGIDEATDRFGLPAQYVEEVMRPIIPGGSWEGAGISAGRRS